MLGIRFLKKHQEVREEKSGQKRGDKNKRHWSYTQQLSGISVYFVPSFLSPSFAFLTS